MVKQIYLLTVWRAEVRNQGGGRVDIWWKLSGWVPDDCLLCQLPWPFLCACTWGKRVSSLVSLPLGTLILSDQGLTLLTSFNLNCFLTGPISKDSHTGGLGLQHTDLVGGGQSIQSVTIICCLFVCKFKIKAAAVGPQCWGCAAAVLSIDFCNSWVIHSYQY